MWLLYGCTFTCDWKTAKRLIDPRTCGCMSSEGYGFYHRETWRCIRTLYSSDGYKYCLTCAVRAAALHGMSEFYQGVCFCFLLLCLIFVWTNWLNSGRYWGIEETMHSYFYSKIGVILLTSTDFFQNRQDKFFVRCHLDSDGNLMASSLHGMTWISKYWSFTADLDQPCWWASHDAR